MTKQTEAARKDEDQHIPVMLEEVLKTLDPREGEKYLDLTAGYGGHASAVIGRTLVWPKAVLVDRDESAVDFLNSKFHGSGVRIIHKDFLSASQELLHEGKTFDLMLADLGVSSPHLNVASRGFSFSQDAKLDMRMDQTQALTAEAIVNSYSQAELEEILRVYGEEPKARAIAKSLVEQRPISTTTQLANIVAHSVKKRSPGHSKMHPATKAFQALRIAVNDELELLKAALPLWLDLLAPGGRLVVITFHSLEDRIVKQFFAENGGERYDAIVHLLTKKPITPSHTEIVFNPRSRSAKLRGVSK